jgi:putative inorganic carbon (HCO3(-)) transporter
MNNGTVETTAPLLDRLPSLLYDSWLFGWLFKLVNWADTTLAFSLQTAWLNKGIQRLFNRNAQTLSNATVVHWLHGILPCIGLVGLFALMLVTDTGLIGGAVWAVFGWLLVTSISLGYNRWLTRLTVVDILVATFFATFFIACAFSSYQHEALSGLFKMATFWAGYCVFRTVMVQLPASIPILMATLVVFGLFEAGFAYLQSTSKVAELATWTDPSTNPEDQLTRVYGTLKPYNPNLLAAYFIATLGACFWWIGQLLGQLTQKTTHLIKQLPWLLLNLLAFGAMAYGLVLTGSRGGYLGITGMVGICFLGLTPLLLWGDSTLKSITWLKKVWLGLLIGLVTIVGLAIFKSSALQHRIASIFAFREDSSISYRLNVYASAWRMFLDNIWTGIGPSNTVFKKVYGFYMTPGYNALGAYSVPLEIALEQGLVGLSVALGFVSYLKVKTLTTVAQLNAVPLQQKLSVAAAFITLTGFLYHGLFDTIWYRPAIQLLFWFFVAVWAISITPTNTPLQPNTLASSVERTIC